MKTKIITLVVLFIFTAVSAAALDMDVLKGLKKQEVKTDTGSLFKYKSKKAPQKNFQAGSSARDFDNSLFYLYIGVKDDKDAFLRMYIQVEPAVDWIKFNKVIFTADDQTFEREFNVQTLNSTMAIRAQFIEFYDEEVMPHEVQIFEKIGAAKKVTIRFIGKERHQDLKLKKNYCRAITDVLEAWKNLNK